MDRPTRQRVAKRIDELVADPLNPRISQSLINAAGLRNIARRRMAHPVHCGGRSPRGVRSDHRPPWPGLQAHLSGSRQTNVLVPNKLHLPQPVVSLTAVPLGMGQCSPADVAQGRAKAAPDGLAIRGRVVFNSARDLKLVRSWIHTAYGKLLVDLFAACGEQSFSNMNSRTHASNCSS